MTSGWIQEGNPIRAPAGVLSTESWIRLAAAAGIDAKRKSQLAKAIMFEEPRAVDAVWSYEAPLPPYRQSGST